MSKAFTREDESAAPLVVRPRAPLPDGAPNYVTRRGLAQLYAELTALRAEQAAIEGGFEDTSARRKHAALTERRAALEARIANAEVVAPPPEPDGTVRFGALVTVTTGDRRRQYTIVGVDEADAARGRISFVSPLAQALLGREVGDSLPFHTPRGEEELEIVSISYVEPSDAD